MFAPTFVYGVELRVNAWGTLYESTIGPPKENMQAAQLI
jgi:hypothetical protein